MGQIADEKEARIDAQQANMTRAERASMVLEEYDVQNEGESAAVDMLSDIRHLCRMNRWDFDRLLSVSENHFNEEVSEEE